MCVMCVCSFGSNVCGVSIQTCVYKCKVCVCTVTLGLWDCLQIHLLMSAVSSYKETLIIVQAHNTYPLCTGIDFKHALIAAAVSLICVMLQADVYSC